MVVRPCERFHFRPGTVRGNLIIILSAPVLACVCAVAFLHCQDDVPRHPHLHLPHYLPVCLHGRPHARRADRASDLHRLHEQLPLLVLRVSSQIDYHLCGSITGSLSSRSFVANFVLHSLDSSRPSELFRVFGRCYRKNSVIFGQAESIPVQSFSRVDVP